MLKHGPLAELALQDPEGFSIAEQALNDFFPSLGQIASLATGSRINNKYGPKYAVSKWETSVAFLATESFANKESLASRMVQARYSGYGRFSCMAMFEFASDPSNAAAGTESPEAAQRDNPPDFNAPHDRNWLLYWAILFTASLEKETGANNLDINVLDFWTQQCEEPASYKAPVDPAWYHQDRKRMGNQDAFDTDVSLRDFAPLVSFGSLRQLRAAGGAAATSFPEDATTVLFRSQNEQFDASSSGTHPVYEQVSTRNMHSYARKKRGRKMLFFIPLALGAAIGGSKLSTSTFGLNDAIRRLIRGGGDDVDGEIPFADTVLNRPHFYDDHASRQRNHFREMLSDVFCNPDERLDVENVVGDPPPWEESLFDTRTTQTRNDLVTPAAERDGDPDRVVSSVGATTSLSYRDFSTQQWVYVTSSDDVESGIRPGFHRLADLRAWPPLDCNQLRNQPCGSWISAGSGSSSSWALLAQLRYIFSLPSVGSRRLAIDASSKTTHHVSPEQDEPASLLYRTGIEALLSARCSAWLYDRNVPFAKQCAGDATAWYMGSTDRGCSPVRLELVKHATFSPVSAYLDRFYGSLPPPRPPPKPPPPFPPGPPPPDPAPAPPRFDTRDAALDVAKQTMRSFCDTVYIVSEETRCAALALNLHTRYELSVGWDPPSLPPLAPGGGDPPPPPPTPPAPHPPLEEARRLYKLAITRATLSTYFVPQVAPSPPPMFPLESADKRAKYAARMDSIRSAELETDAPSTPVRVSAEKRLAMLTRVGAIANTAVDALAACTHDLTSGGAPLPCRTSVVFDRCVDGARRCDVSTYRNGYEPWVELDFRSFEDDPARPRYLFAVVMRIPPQEEYGRLLFHALNNDVVESRGWRLTAYDDHHHELPVQCQSWVKARATEHTEGLVNVEHACLPAIAEPEAYYTMSRARFLRITLIGAHRQIWLDRIDVYFRSIVGVDARSPPPPPPPYTQPPLAPPDSPTPPPHAECHKRANVAPPSWEDHVVAVEPCGITFDECCGLAQEHATSIEPVSAFVLSATGCCALLGGSTGAVVNGSVAESYQFGSSATGILPSG